MFGTTIFLNINNNLRYNTKEYNKKTLMYLDCFKIQNSTVSFSLDIFKELVFNRMFLNTIE